MRTSKDMLVLVFDFSILNLVLAPRSSNQIFLLSFPVKFSCVTYQRSFSVQFFIIDTAPFRSTSVVDQPNDSLIKAEPESATPIACNT